MNFSWRKAAGRSVLSALVAAVAAIPQAADGSDVAPFIQRVNIIDGADERDSILAIGAVARPYSRMKSRASGKSSGHVGCFLPSPSVGSGALFLTNNQIITAGHILFDLDRQSALKVLLPDPGSRAADDRPHARAARHPVRRDTAKSRLERRLRHRATGRTGAGREAVSGRREPADRKGRPVDRDHGASGRHGA